MFQALLVQLVFYQKISNC